MRRYPTVPVLVALAALSASPVPAWLAGAPLGAVAAETTPARSVADAQAALAWKLIEKTSAGADAIVSPASLASAFAVLDLAADKPMQAALLKAAGFSGLSPAEASKALANAREALSTADPAVVVSADKLVFPPNEAPRELLLAGLKALKVSYDVADLTTQAGVEAVDKWVSETTKGQIPEILGKPLDRASFVALNALYFKGKWKERFDPAATAETPFTGADGKTQPAMLMRLAEGDRAFRTDKTFIAVDLPFDGDRFSLVVVTSIDKARPLKEFVAVKGWLGGDGFQRHKGDLALPRFSLEGSEDLIGALKSDLADGLKSPTALVEFGAGATIGGILQRTKIEVDEQGATAAAATAIVVTRALAVNDDTYHMIVDKPYLFALRDRQSGLILAAGYVAKAPNGAVR